MDTAIKQKVDAFFESYTLRKFGKGQVLIHAHDNPIHVYYLLDGKVRQYDITDRGDEVVVNIFKAPSFFPMSVAINKTPNKYFFEAVTPVQIRQAPSHEVVEFVKSNPDVMFDLLARLFSGLDGVLGRVVRLMGGSARTRLLYELLIECRRFGERKPDGSYFITISGGDIAARAGLTRETVSRQLHALRTSGLVKLENHGVYIPDPAALEDAVAEGL